MIDMCTMNIFPGTIYHSESKGVSVVLEGGHTDVIVEGRRLHERTDR